MSERTTTFAWDPPPRRRRLLFIFIAGSLVAHVATFFLFRVVYPERATIAAAAPAVSVLDPSRPDHQTLLRLIEAEDPAPAAATHAAVPANFLKVPYRPSYSVARTLPRLLPETAEKLEYPPVRDPLEIIRETTATAPPEPAASKSARSRLSIDGPLAARELRAPAPIAIQTRQSEVLQPATFLIGVKESGDTPFVFLQQSSGDSIVDEAATRHLLALTFDPADEPIVWSHAVFHWGADAYAAPAP